MVFGQQHKALKEIKNTRQTLASHCFCLPHYVLCSHHWGRHTQPPSFVPLFGVFDGTLRCYATVAVTPRHSYASFSRRRYYLFANAQGKKKQSQQHP